MHFDESVTDRWMDRRTDLPTFHWMQCIIWMIYYLLLYIAVYHPDDVFNAVLCSILAPVPTWMKNTTVENDFFSSIIHISYAWRIVFLCVLYLFYSLFCASWVSAGSEYYVHVFIEKLLCSCGDFSSHAFSSFEGLFVFDTL